MPEAALTSPLSEGATGNFPWARCSWRAMRRTTFPRNEMWSWTAWFPSPRCRPDRTPISSFLSLRSGFDPLGAKPRRFDYLPSNSSNEQTYLDVVARSIPTRAYFPSGPPSLHFASFASDVVFADPLQLQPSSTGQSEHLRGATIFFMATADAIGMSDQPVSQVASPDAPSNLTFISLPFGRHVLHGREPSPERSAAGADLRRSGHRRCHFRSGQIRRCKRRRQHRLPLAFAGQNLNPNQITTIRAGGNISYLSTDTSQSLTLSGPGQFDIIAGGNVDLGLTSGIATYGNVLNPNLASSRGSVGDRARRPRRADRCGRRHSSTDFVGKIVGASSAYQSMLTDYVEGVTGESNLTFAASAPIFRGLSLPEQLPLIEQIFFSELVLSGEEANEAPSLGFTRGYNAIDSLFPTSRGTTSPYSGDISLGFSRIYTLDGGYQSPGSGRPHQRGPRDPPPTSRIRIVRRPRARHRGRGLRRCEHVHLRQHFVNQSRVFTADGGDILIWSTRATSTRGSGAKTSISAPPPTIDRRCQRQCHVDLSACACRLRDPDDSVDLPGVSPGTSTCCSRGFVNAGDAGIGRRQSQHRGDTRSSARATSSSAASNRRAAGSQRPRSAPRRVRAVASSATTAAVEAVEQQHA